ncbi:MAG: bifunctional phosphopantothenoylcysteine decarboxylase/phosphopantothenate--cysteine ligase CoaBC [Rhodospirillaceae bacterium]|nr:bifunctional phosphopantothenoylcysteine decarboxylase/phosphopantothenate--cysteine ligase CoaBC [Rhodospirillaceae bacterium]
MSLSGRHILLIISGGIAAYKCLDLIRRLRELSVSIKCVLTKSGAHFVTSMSLAALSENKVYEDMFSLDDDCKISHIQASRESDLLLVMPATANLIAKMAHGLADDLASTLLLASNRPILIVPAMNVVMWNNQATQSNLDILRNRGIMHVIPESGKLACGEEGDGHIAETSRIIEAIESICAANYFTGPLSGRRILITSGPTVEPIDPVRFISNRSSGKQGHAIAKEFHELGAIVTLISGPVALSDPKGVKVIKVETAMQMMTACLDTLPVDIAVCVAAVSDWRVMAEKDQKIKRDKQSLILEMTSNPDILMTLSKSRELQRPKLVVGFVSETEKLIDSAKFKLNSKGCDLIVANDVSGLTFGSDNNQVHLINHDGIDSWPLMSKMEVARRLANCLVEMLKLKI